MCGPTAYPGRRANPSPEVRPSPPRPTAETESLGDGTVGSALDGATRPFKPSRERAPTGLGEAKHRHQHGHEKKRAPEPDHPARIVRHPYAIRSDEEADSIRGREPSDAGTGRRPPTPGRKDGKAPRERAPHARLRRPACIRVATCVMLPRSVAGWSRLAARRAHNPKVGGSNPPPATNSGKARHSPLGNVGLLMTAPRFTSFRPSRART